MTRASVMIMAGGTGGHIFPGLAVAQQLKSRGIPVIWLGGARGLENRLVPAAGYHLEQLPVRGVRGGGFNRWLSAPYNLTRAVFGALRVLRQNRPRSVLSMGGYAAGPGGIAAWLLRIPLLVHEQNRVPGLTNRILKHLAQRIFCGFPDTFVDSEKVTVCGNPVRDEIVKISSPVQRLAGRSGAIQILVLGGSQGALSLNRSVPRALALLVRKECRLDVWHQSGRDRGTATTAEYAGTGLTSRVTEFIDDMAAAYAWADLVICRAGALTVAELSVAGIGALFIPYPHAVDDHQRANAMYLVEAGAALHVDEQLMTPGELADQLFPVLADRRRLQKMAEAAFRLRMIGAAGIVAEACAGSSGDE